MKILVVGGTGMIGGHAALRLAGLGHDVTIAGRSQPAAGTPLGALGYMRIDYIAEDIAPARLAGFDALIFAAGNDIRHVPKGGDFFGHVWHANAVAQPRFFAAAKAAGVQIAINIGSYYPHVMPERLAEDTYMRSRKAAHDGIAALAGPAFKVISLDCPFVLGAVPGLDTMFKAYVLYAQGAFAPMPVFSPPGGVNFISTNSISDAIEAVLAGAGENGRAYLLGDENITFDDYFGTFFEALGHARPPVLDQEHPMLPDGAMPWGRGGTLYYEPDAAEAAMLNYRRQDVLRTIREEIVPQYRG